VTADLMKEQSALDQDMSQCTQRHDSSVNTTLPAGTQIRTNRIGSGTFSRWGARLLDLSRRHEESLQATFNIRNTLREEEAKLSEIVVRALLKVGRLPFEAGGEENRQSPQVPEMINASAVPNTALEKRLDGNGINKSSTGGSSLGHRPSGLTCGQAWFDHAGQGLRAPMVDSIMYSRNGDTITRRQRQPMATSVSECHQKKAHCATPMAQDRGYSIQKAGMQADEVEITLVSSEGYDSVGRQAKQCTQAREETKSERKEMK